MTDYSELVKALRCCGNEGCHKCPYQKHIHEKFCWVIAMKDAATAIEDMAKHITEMHERVTVLQIARGELEAEVKRLKEANDELREKQTFIDHYGAEWITSAKDVPTAAYKHGYADGRAEVKLQFPKRGKWITIRLNNGGSYTGCSCCEAPIPTDTMLDYIPKSESKYCYSCGAKMEVQE